MNKHLVYKKQQKDSIQYASFFFFFSLKYIQNNNKCSAIIFIL